MLASRFRTKKLPSNQNLPYSVLNTRFSLIYASANPDANRNLYQYWYWYWIKVLPLPLATLLIIASSSSTPHWEKTKQKNNNKKTTFAMGYFSWQIMIHRYRRQEVPLSGSPSLVHWLARVVCEPL